MAENKKTVTEQYFEQVPRANERIAEYQWQLQKAAARAYGLSSASGLTNTRVQASPGREAAFVHRLEGKDRTVQRLSGKIRRLQLLVGQASGLVEKYTAGREKKVLTLRYLKGYEWLQVSGQVDSLSPKQLRRIGRKGLERIVLPEDAIWMDGDKRAA